MSKVILGKAGRQNLTLDLHTLLTTRMLVTSDSGGGKTYALKRICEQIFGKMQILVIDPEGEFSPLRTKYDFVLVGPGGETPADVRSARLLAERLLETRASAICDLYEMKPSQRHEWVRLFLEGLIEAPKRLRHPCLVIVDEAHMFCPEHGKGESPASEMMISLCTRGRKRLLCPLFATQRLATLSKDASSMLLNRLIGPTFEDINRRRAADVLGIQKSDERAFFKEIQLLEPGHFYALGRAITRERVLVHIGAIQTPHGQEALKYETAPPPPLEKVKAMLPKLKDLPQAAEEKARTEAEFRQEIRVLKAQLRSAPVATASNTPKVIQQRVADPRAVQEAVRKVDQQRRAEIQQRDQAVRKLVGTLASISANLAGMAKSAAAAAGVKLPELKAIEIKLPPPVRSPESAQQIHPVADPERSRRERVAAQPRRVEGRSTEPPPAGVTTRQVAILRALAEFEAIGRDAIPRTWVAARSGASHRSSAYTNNLGALRSAGMIEYGAGSTVRLTEEGRAAAPQVQAPLTTDEMLESCLRIVGQKQGAILKALHEIHPESLSRQELAERAGASPNSSAYTNNLGALRSAGIIDYGPDSTVKCADWLFID